MDIAFYKKLYVEKRALNTKFTHADMSNHLFRAEDNGVSIVLSMDDAFFGIKKEEYAARAGRFIGRYVQVYVTNIDEEKQIVTASQREYKSQRLATNRERIAKDLSAGKPVTSDARIIGIHGTGKGSFALVRLLDCGLLGVVWCEDWSTEYTTDIKDVARPGEIIRVSIEEVNNSSGTTNADYRCSRAATLDNPWVAVEGKLHRGDIVNAKILEKWNGGFSGKLEGFRDVTAWVALPDKDKLRLIPGMLYQCEVLAVDAKRKNLKLRPFRLCYVD